MELFQYKLEYIPTNTSTDSLAFMCNNSRLNGSEFARWWLMDLSLSLELNWRDVLFFFRAQYCRNNFNDYLSSLILLFELTVVNQWHSINILQNFRIICIFFLVLASGFVLVTTKWARLYFLIFHLCAVIVVLK